VVRLGRAHAEGGPLQQGELCRRPALAPARRGCCAARPRRRRRTCSAPSDSCTRARTPPFDGSDSLTRSSAGEPSAATSTDLAAIVSVSGVTTVTRHGSAAAAPLGAVTFAAKEPLSTPASGATSNTSRLQLAPPALPTNTASRPLPRAARRCRRTSGGLVALAALPPPLPPLPLLLPPPALPLLPPLLPPPLPPPLGPRLPC
jgi:hypothetical protein